MFGISAWELIVVGIVAILLFGSRLPSVARSLGRSLNEFKRGMSEVESEFKDSVYSEPKGRVGYGDPNEPKQTHSEQRTEEKQEVGD
jgi:sec-independent protein translocase protein TatA